MTEIKLVTDLDLILSWCLLHCGMALNPGTTNVVRSALECSALDTVLVCHLFDVLACVGFFTGLLVSHFDIKDLFFGVGDFTWE